MLTWPTFVNLLGFFIPSAAADLQPGGGTMVEYWQTAGARRLLKGTLLQRVA